MNEFRFSCGKCGQHLKAEVDCVNVVIQCPICSARIRVPEPGKAGEALPVAPETTDALTPPRGPEAAPMAWAVPHEPGPIGPPSRLEPPEEAAPPPSEITGKRRVSPVLLGAGIAIPLIAAAVALWIWKPWLSDQTMLPPASPLPVTTPSNTAPPKVAAPATNAVAPDVLNPSSPEPTAGTNLAATPAEPPASQPAAHSPAARPKGVMWNLLGKAVRQGARLLPHEKGAAPAKAVPSAETKPEVPTKTNASFAAAWEVDFGTQPEEALAVIEAQLKPLGLSVSPSIYTATSGRRVKLPARRGTRLELIEAVGQQIGWKPLYAGRQLKFERGVRKEPVAFAGPFMLEVTKVNPSSAFGTAKLTLRVTGVGIPDALRRQWEQAPLRLVDLHALTPEGTDLYDPGAEMGYRLLSPRGGPLMFEQEVGLHGAYRNVVRVAVFRAALRLPELKPPANRLQFELRDLALKPGPDTPETARPLVFEGATPVPAKVISTLPGDPFYRARVEVRNEADRPLRAVTFTLTYFDAAGKVLGTSSYTQKGSATLPGPRERRVLGRVPLRDRRTTRPGWA
jgi:DNA-directed RNA polymerase subunit RPC12/RpoP